MQTLKLTKKYDKYPEYRDSEALWLGKIPNGWEAKKLQYLFEIKKRIAGKIGPDILSITQRGIKIKNIESNDGQLSSDYSKYQIVEKNDFAMNHMDLLTGFVDISQYNGVISPDYRVFSLRKKNNSDRYFLYLLQIGYLLRIFYAHGRGAAQFGRWRLPASEFKAFIFPVPSDNEQKNIVRYLNEKTSSIDQIIEKKQKQIELLRERRTAFINYSLFEAKGELVKIKNHVMVNPTKKAVSGTDLEDTVSFVPMEAISEDGKLTLQEKKYEDVKDGFTYFRNGDVVLAKITPCYENGKAGVMKNLKNGFGFGTTEFMVLRPKNSILADYLYYLIYSDKFRKSGEVEMRGTAGQKRVTTSFVRNYEFLLPSLDLQREIVNLLNKKIDLFDSAIKKAESSIQFLQELKSSLISNVVTGKVKV